MNAPVEKTQEDEEEAERHGAAARFDVEHREEVKKRLHDGRRRVKSLPQTSHEGF